MMNDRRSRAEKESLVDKDALLFFEGEQNLFRRSHAQLDQARCMKGTVRCMNSYFKKKICLSRAFQVNLQMLHLFWGR